jgi:hypothetical protein
LRLYRARALGKLERWVAACDDYDAILRSTVAQGETPVTAQAREAAAQEINDAYARTARVSLLDTERAPREVRLDGVIWPREQLDRARAVDPGPHTVDVTRADGTSTRTVVTLAEGESFPLSLQTFQRVELPQPEAALPPVPSRAAQQRSHAPASGATPVSAGDALQEQREPGRRADETFQLDIAPLASMNSRVTSSGSAFDGVEKSDALITRIAVSWYPFGDPVRDLLGFSGSWATDVSGEFQYAEYLAGIQARHFLGNWRLGAKLDFGNIQASSALIALNHILLRPTISAGLGWGDVSIGAEASVRVPVSYISAPIKAATYRYGLEGRFVLDYRVWRWLGLQLSASLLRVAFDLRTSAGATSMDSGSVQSQMATEGVQPQMATEGVQSRMATEGVQPQMATDISAVDLYTTWYAGLTVNL